MVQVNVGTQNLQDYAFNSRQPIHTWCPFKTRAINNRTKSKQFQAILRSTIENSRSIERKS